MSAPVAAPTGRLELVVHLREGQDLEKMDLMSESDPYVTFRVDKDVKTQQTSSTKEDQKDPNWHETFQFNLGKSFKLDAASQSELHVEVYDRDPVGADFIGSAAVPLWEIWSQAEHSLTRWLSLKDPKGKKASTGRVLVELTLISHERQKSALHRASSVGDGKAAAASAAGGESKEGAAVAVEVAADDEDEEDADFPDETKLKASDISPEQLFMYQVVRGIRMTARESGRRLDTVVDGEIKASTFAVTPAGSGSSDAKADGKADGKRESVALVDAGGRKTGPPRHSDAWVEAVATEEYHYSLATAAHVNEKVGVISVTDYAPVLFHSLRRFCGIDTADYVKAWNYALSEIEKPKEGAGRSGSLFLLSKDKRFIFKSLPPHEVLTLRTTLAAYYRHLTDRHWSTSSSAAGFNGQQHTPVGSRVMRIVGLHRFHNTLTNNFFYLIVAQNVLFSAVPDPKTGLLTMVAIHEKYDLKGRRPKHKPKEIKGNVIKDNQIERVFHCSESDRKAFLQGLERDVNFLQSHKMMDYSLLIGVHHSDAINFDEQKHAAEAGSAASDAKSDSKGDAKGDGKQSALQRRAIDGHREQYYIGIIDFLSRYGAKKKVAHFFKSMRWKDETLSTIPPEKYAQRFLSYMPSIFPTCACSSEQRGAAWTENRDKAIAAAAAATDSQSGDFVADDDDEDEEEKKSSAAAGSGSAAAGSAGGSGSGAAATETGDVEVPVHRERIMTLFRTN